ncbi:hypothetical protein LIER_18585 [Lithospermum erythrorhizon]|uniref:Uncharacterized protein n=1 Tax=Lithospermum erythrorhizon TaxID=34254 RepID=A0AAV3QEI2_LITER
MVSFLLTTLQLQFCRKGWELSSFTDDSTLPWQFCTELRMEISTSRDKLSRRVQHHHFLPFLFPENDVLNKLHDFCDEETPFLVELNQVLSFDSKRVPCPHPGRIWLEQKGLQRALYWKIEALVLLDLQEFLNSVSTLDSSLS